RSIQRISVIGDAGRTERTVGTLCWKRATIKTPTPMSLPSSARTAKEVRDGARLYRLETTTSATYCLILDGRVQTWRMGPQIELAPGSHGFVEAAPALLPAVFSRLVSGKYGKSGKIPTLTMSRIFQKIKKQKNVRLKNRTDL